MKITYRVRDQETHEIVWEGYDQGDAQGAMITLEDAYNRALYIQEDPFIV